MESNKENKENKNIYQRLQQARVALQEKKLPKTGKNEYAKFKYYELSDFLPSVNQIFLDTGLTTCFNLSEDKAELTLINLNDPTERIIFSTYLPEKYEQKGSTPVQQLGGLHTYLKRYLYMNALEIVENDSIDCQKPKEESKPTKKQETEYEDEIPEYVKITPPSKANPGVQTSKPPMSREQVFSYLTKFLSQPEKDHKKAYGWKEKIIASSTLSNDDKWTFLTSIDQVYDTKYHETFEASLKK